MVQIWQQIRISALSKAMLAQYASVLFDPIRVFVLEKGMVSLVFRSEITWFLNNTIFSFTTSMALDC